MVAINQTDRSESLLFCLSFKDAIRCYFNVFSLVSCFCCFWKPLSNLFSGTFRFITQNQACEIFFIITKRLFDGLFFSVLQDGAFKLFSADENWI